MEFINIFLYYLDKRYVFYALFVLYLIWSISYIFYNSRKISSSKKEGIPIAKAGSDQIVTSDNLITLDASESFDPDGGNLSYLWEQVEGETVDLVDTATKNPKFTPANPGVYRFSLKVKNDKGKESVTDDVSVLVSANGNSENLRELFLVMDELFGKLPKREVKKFVKTVHYQIYKKALHEHGVR